MLEKNVFRLEILGKLEQSNGRQIEAELWL